MLRKVRHEKCDPFLGEDRHGPVVRTNHPNSTTKLIDILLQKVRHEKCDPLLKVVLLKVVVFRKRGMVLLTDQNLTTTIK